MNMVVKAEKSAIHAISLFGTQPEIEEDEVPVGIALRPDASPRAAGLAPSNLVDLTGKPKVWLTIGRGKTGKTTLIRFLVEETIGAGRQVVIADVDRTNATLASYFEGVQRPPEGDESSVSAWLERLLTFTMAKALSAYIDLGGGDTTLRRLVAEVRDLVAMLEAAGVAVVAAYLLGPQTDDLSPLATLEHAGFQPAATALVLNEGLIEASLPREEAFARVLRHSVFREAMARGAVALWMPRLLPAGEIEARRVLFGQAATGVPREGRKQTPLGPFDQGRTRGWLTQMRAELAPVQSWMA
jgi:hypothetical protein